MSPVEFVATDAGRFKVSGILTRDTVVPLWHQRDMLCQSQENIIIDLTELEHCDSAGLAFLFALYSGNGNCQRNLQFTNASDQLMRLVQLSDLDEVLPISSRSTS